MALVCLCSAAFADAREVSDTADDADDSREKAIRDVLFRHPEPTDVERDFVTGQMRVPAAWLAESKVSLSGLLY